jgi:hypothetical protein
MELFREMRLEIGRPEGTGVLYGLRHRDDLRVLAARRTADPKDPRLAGYEALGICVLRARGHVFLTEADLEKFEETKATLALVVAGEQAGFFVRDPKGAIQSIQSYEEFSIAEPKQANPAASAAKPRPVRRLVRRKKKRVWWPAVACAGIAVLSIPLFARPLWQPLLPKPPLSLSVRDEGGLVVASWSQAALRGTATLEIADGDTRMIEPVTADQASFTYQPHGSDLEIRLTANDPHGRPRSEVARLIIPPRVPSALAQPNIPELKNIAELETEATLLRQAAEQGRARAAALQRQIATLESQR